MTTRPPLAALLDKARAGDATAWQGLVERFRPWALRQARRRLPPGLPAEDAVQEALLIACSKLGDLREDQAFPSWLAAIVNSQCLRLMNARRPELSLDEAEVRGLLPARGVTDPETALCTREMLAAFDAALENLPGRLRDVCRLHFRRGLSVPEVAQACALPEGTVKKRLFTARPLLQERLARFRCEDLFRVGYMPVSDHLLAMCADHLNQARALPLLSRRYLSWAALTRDLERGRLDAAFIMTPLALDLHGRGTPLLYVLDGHHDGSAISVARSEDRPWRMGLPGQTSTHRVLLHHLLQERPKLPLLPTVVVNPSAVAGSLRQNEIGSFFCAEPWSAKCRCEGLTDRVLLSRDILPGHLCCILAVRREFAQRRGQVVADYVRLLLSARDRVRRDPAFAAGVQSARTGIDRDIARLVLEERTVSFEDLEPDTGRMASFTRLAHAAGVLPDPGVPEGFVCKDFALQASA